MYQLRCHRIAGSVRRQDAAVRPGDHLAERGSHHLLLAGALGLAAALRFTALGARSWWRDEAVTVELLRLPFGELLRTIPESEGTPPLYYVLTWIWSRAFGDSEAGLRSFSALVGTLTVLVVYLAGRELVSRRAGIVAAYLAASSPLLVWHDQDARAYALLVLLCAASLLFFLRLRRAPSALVVAGFTAASALALLTHYFALFIVLPEIVWLLVSRGTRRTAIVPAVVTAGVGLALVPLALAQSGNVSWVAEVPRLRRVIEVAQGFLVGPQPPWEVPVTVLAGLVFLVAVALLVFRGSEREQRAVQPAAIVGGAAVLVPMVLAFGGLDYVLARNLIVAWVPLALVVAGGLAARHAGVAGPTVTLIAVALGVGVVVSTASTPKFGAEDWRGAARALGPPPPGGRVIVLWPDVGAAPYLVYRPGAKLLPNDGTFGSEVVLVVFGSRRQDPEFQESLSPPGPPFTLRSREIHSHFTTLRFRAPRSVRITAETLGGAEGMLDAAVMTDRRSR